MQTFHLLRLAQSLNYLQKGKLGPPYSTQVHITVQEVQDQLKNTNPTKAQEPDDISPTILILKNVLALAKLFNVSLTRKQLSFTRTVKLMKYHSSHKTKVVLKSQETIDR